jgi:antitoxin PrlF
MRTKDTPTLDGIRELATLTSKGQITLPKSIRQALRVATGSKIVFELRGGDVVVSRAAAEHEDPAIGTFLGLLEADVREGRHVRALPEKLARAMLRNAGSAEEADEIEGEVAL